MLSLTKIYATFPMVFCRLLSDSLIIQITNCSKRCACQQNVIDSFSPLTQEIVMITFSDGRISHIDKVKYFSVQNSVD